MCVYGFLHRFRFFKDSVDEALKLQFCENSVEFCLVGFYFLQFVEFEFDGYVRLDGCKEEGHADVINMFFYFFLQFSLDFIDAVDEFIHTTELVDEFHGGLLTYTGAAREIVSRVAHECQEVDDLKWGRDVILFRYLLWSHYFIASSVAWTIDVDVVADQLSVVFIGGEHIGFDADGISFFSQSTDNVVCLVAVNLNDGYVVGFQNILDDGDCFSDVFRCLFTLCLVGRECLIAKRRPVRVECHADVCGLLFGEHLVEGIDEAHDGRRIQPF